MGERGTLDRQLDRPPPTTDTGTIYLTGGQDYDLKLEYYEGGLSATIQLKWADPTMDTPLPIPPSQLFPPFTDSLVYLHFLPTRAIPNCSTSVL